MSKYICNICKEFKEDVIDLHEWSNAESKNIVRKDYCSMCKDCILTYFDNCFKNSETMKCGCGSDITYKILPYIDEKIIEKYKERINTINGISTITNVNYQCCSKCGFLIEKTEGCDNMKCKCGKLFKWDRRMTNEQTPIIRALDKIYKRFVEIGLIE